MPISKELLEILACPKCKGDIRLNEKGDGLICDTMPPGLRNQGRHPHHAH